MQLMAEPSTQGAVAVLMQMTPMELAYQFSCVQLAESKRLACPHAEQVALNAVSLASSMLGREGVESLMDRMHAASRMLVQGPAPKATT